MDIDFVIPWVDGNDPEWQRDFRRYSKSDETEGGSRYRDWGWMKYWFRSVEKNAPWVHKIYFVTNGQIPEWLNLDNPKLVHVKHSDYIPKEYLPTFNSSTIEIFFNRIVGLSEHFVLFNDDFFINAPITPEYYFREGLPCDSPCEQVFSHPYIWKGNRWGIQLMEYCNTSLINRHFNRKEVTNNNKWGWYGWYQPKRFVLNAWMAIRHSFFGVPWTPHFEKPMLKSVWDEVWDLEGDLLLSHSTRFREPDNFNCYLMRFWALALNKFYPYNPFRYKCKCELGYDKKDPVSIIGNSSYKSICIEDTPMVTDDSFMTMKARILDKFDQIYPNKSAFEL